MARVKNGVGTICFCVEVSSCVRIGNCKQTAEELGNNRGCLGWGETVLRIDQALPQTEMVAGVAVLFDISIFFFFAKKAGILALQNYVTFCKKSLCSHRIPTCVFFPAPSWWLLETML